MKRKLLRTHHACRTWTATPYAQYLSNTIVKRLLPPARLLPTPPSRLAHSLWLAWCFTPLVGPISYFIDASAIRVGCAEEECAGADVLRQRFAHVEWNVPAEMLIDAASLRLPEQIP